MDTEQEQIPHDQGTPEQQAERLGWVPQERYKGRKPWIDAEEYLRQLEEDSPRLRHINAKLVREIASVKETNREILAHHERQIAQERQDAYDRAAADISSKHAQAVAAGDVDGATKALNEQRALDKQISNPAPPAKRQLSDEEKEEIASFQEENKDWYGVDPEMTKFAQEYESGLARQGKSLSERLIMTKERVQRRFPQEFSDMNNDLDDEPVTRQPPPRAPQGRNNSSGVRRPAPKPAPGSYESLNSTGKSACDKFCSANPDKAKAKATWLKFAQNDPSLFN